jgi:hypothetical protein
MRKPFGAVYLMANIVDMQVPLSQPLRVKLGESYDPARRRNELQVGCASELFIIGALWSETYIEIEGVLKHELYQFKTRKDDPHGEWHDFPNDILMQLFDFFLPFDDGGVALYLRKMRKLFCGWKSPLASNMVTEPIKLVEKLKTAIEQRSSTDLEEGDMVAIDEYEGIWQLDLIEFAKNKKREFRQQLVKNELNTNFLLQIYESAVKAAQDLQKSGNSDDDVEELMLTLLFTESPFYSSGFKWIRTKRRNSPPVDEIAETKSIPLTHKDLPFANNPDPNKIPEEITKVPTCNSAFTYMIERMSGALTSLRKCISPEHEHPILKGNGMHTIEPISDNDIKLFRKFMNAKDSK